MKTDFLDIFFDPLNDIDVMEALKESISKNEDAIMDLNRQQLDRGLDADGKSLGRYANFAYKGRFEPVDLKNTGDFRNKFSLQIDNKQTEIFSQDWKNDKLTKRYGKNIFGIPVPLVVNMEEIIEPDFVKEYQKQLK
jgi:hypothetical protein